MDVNTLLSKDGIIMAIIAAIITALGTYLNSNTKQENETPLKKIIVSVFIFGLIFFVLVIIYSMFFFKDKKTVKKKTQQIPISVYENTTKELVNGVELIVPNDTNVYYTKNGKFILEIECKKDTSIDIFLKKEGYTPKTLYNVSSKNRPTNSLYLQKNK